MAYGTIIPDLIIDGQPAPYPVLNERSIRATAGIMLLVGTITLFWTLLTGDRTLMTFVVPLFWLEFFLKSVLGPQWSFFALPGHYLVRKQRPEWVGAIQKRFAWSLGLAMATAMLIVTQGLGLRGAVPLSICLTCLGFMWLESTCGICVGCIIYKHLVRLRILPEPAVQPACPGGACSLKKPA